VPPETTSSNCHGPGAAVGTGALTASGGSEGSAVTASSFGSRVADLGCPVCSTTHLRSRLGFRP
jgi:hypothetical protein